MKYSLDKSVQLPKFDSFTVKFNSKKYFLNISSEACSWILTTSFTHKILQLLNRGLTIREVIKHLNKYPAPNLKKIRGEERLKKICDSVNLFLVYLNKSQFAQNTKLKIMSHNVSEINIHFKTTNYCNFNCSFCIEDSSSARKKELEIGKLTTIFKELAGYFKDPSNFVRKDNIHVIRYSKKLPSVTLSGGEFLQRDDSIEIINLLYDLGFQINVFSNGYDIARILTKDTLNKIKTLQISIDGPIEFHHLGRKIGSYNQIIDNLKKISKLKKSGIHIAVLFSYLHFDRIRKTGFTNSLKQYFHFFDSIIEISPGIRFICDSQKIGGRSKKELKYNLIIKKFIEKLSDKYDDHFVKKKFNFKKGNQIINCGFGYSFFISPEGKIHPCVLDTMKFNSMGNLNDDRFSNIFEELLKKQYDTSILNMHSICQKCSYARTLCHGGCKIKMVDKNYNLKMDNKNCPLVHDKEAFRDTIHQVAEGELKTKIFTMFD